MIPINLLRTLQCETVIPQFPPAMTPSPIRRMCSYLDKVVGAEAEELQQLEVAACRQDILDHSRLKHNLTREDRQGQSVSIFFALETSVPLQLRT